MGLRSGNLDGHGRTEMLWFLKKSWTTWARWAGALPCWSFQARVGRRFPCRKFVRTTQWYSPVTLLPNTWRQEGPSCHMDAQTWTEPPPPCRRACVTSRVSPRCLQSLTRSQTDEIVTHSSTQLHGNVLQSKRRDSEPSDAALLY